MNRRSLKLLSFTKVEILDNGRLIVDGGDATKDISNIAEVGGGAGGIIQIISPVGNLTPGSLSLGYGTKIGSCKDTNEANGYYCLQGMSIQRSFMRFDKFLVSSRAVPSI